MQGVSDTNSSMDIQFLVLAQCAHVDVQNLQSGGRGLLQKVNDLRGAHDAAAVGCTATPAEISTFVNINWSQRARNSRKLPDFLLFPALEYHGLLGVLFWALSRYRCI